MEKKTLNVNTKKNYPDMSILNFHIVWYDAPHVLVLLVTRSLAANVGTKMAAGGGIAGSENQLILSFQWTKALLAEAEQCIHAFSVVGDRPNTNVHERLSEAGETVFILKDSAAELIRSDRDSEMANFHRNMDELCSHLTRL